MPRFQVTGYSKTTNRQRTRIYEVRNKEDAIKMAASEGIIVDVNSIIILPDPPPTERQIEYAKKFDIKITKDTTGPQLSKLLAQAEDEDWPTKSQLRRAKRLGIQIKKGITGCELEDLIDDKEYAIEEEKERIREQKEDERFVIRTRKRRKTKKASKVESFLGLVVMVIIIFVLLKSCGTN
jgi:hypothetical protein